jgi:hypothetical protein
VNDAIDLIKSCRLRLALLKPLFHKGFTMSLITELSDAKGRLKALADKSSELRGYL